jgi:fucose 4-O-acetylase-like acetyltransferase
MRVHSFDCFKFLAMAGVIIAHLPPGGRFDSAAWATIELAQKATGWCVLAFFVVSGALFQSGISRSPGPELARRAVRLLVPWLSFSLFYKILVCGLAFGGVIKNTQQIPRDGSDLWQWLMDPADPQLYFLLYLFVMQAFLLLLHRVNGRAPLIVGAMAFLLWFILLVPESGVPLLHGPSLKLVPLYFAFLTFGLFCGTSLKRVALVSALGSLMAPLIAVTQGSWLIACQLVAPWILLMVLCAGEGWSALKPLAWLGRFSGGVYVWHAPLIIGAVSIASVTLLGHGFAAVIATILLSFVCAAAVGAWVNRTSWMRWFHI